MPIYAARLQTMPTDAALVLARQITQTGQFVITHPALYTVPAAIDCIETLLRINEIAVSD